MIKIVKSAWVVFEFTGLERGNKSKYRIKKHKISNFCDIILLTGLSMVFFNIISLQKSWNTIK